ncbi:MAG: sulfatase-like hydrolase/transferase [Gammaproteobacteria bacterium]
MPPNILFLFPDQHRGDWLGFRGAPGVRTPNLDSLAARGVAFTNALTPSPLCSPARACLASGRRYDAQPVRHNQDDYPDVGGPPTVYQALRGAGYQVLGCGKFDLLKMSQDWGENGQHGAGDNSRMRTLGFSGGIDSAGKHDFVTAHHQDKAEPYQQFLRQRGLLEIHLEDFLSRASKGDACYLNTEPTPLPDDAYCDNWIAENGLTLLRSVPDNSPWFLQVNFDGPHEPVDITAAMLERRRHAEPAMAPIHNTQYPLVKHLEIRRNYSAMVENIDTQIGRFLQFLEDTGQIDNTIIVYASDHGDMLGDHNKWHKSMPEHGALSVPLIFAGPGIQSRSAVDQPVDLVDVSSTFLDLTSIAPLAAMHGQPLTPLLTGDALDIPFRTAGLGMWRALFDGRYKYIHNYHPNTRLRDIVPTRWHRDPDAPATLYDLCEDPGETTNLVRVQPERVRQMREALLASID